MRPRTTAAIFLISTAAWATEQAPAPKESPDLSGLLTEGKKPCDADKKKAEAEAAAQKNEEALKGLLATDKKAEPAPKNLGAVPAMGNCK